MKHAISATFFVLAIFATAAAAQSDEKDAVRVPLMNYIKGHETGQGEYFRKAFHTEGSMVWMRDGKFTSRTFAEYIAGASGKPAADEKDRRRSIEGIEIAGTAATAKIILDYPNVRFVDFMSLLKIDGEWKIVSKVFYAEPKNTK
ncbi:MAG: nuclear transport factor 2 family protein [Acidobacteria bacterium]|nr:nuclear transport factor 2 family protein [Acidobacteriota bacterium]